MDTTENEAVGTSITSSNAKLSKLEITLLSRYLEYTLITTENEAVGTTGSMAKLLKLEIPLLPRYLRCTLAQ